MNNFLSPGLMFESIIEIEANKLFLVLIEMLHLIGNESNGDFVHVDEEMIFMVILIDKEIHKVAF